MLTSITNYSIQNFSLGYIYVHNLIPYKQIYSDGCTKFIILRYLNRFGDVFSI